MRFSLTGGQRADVSQAIPLLTGIETGAVIADKGYESNRLLAFIRDQGAEAVIPPKSNRRDPWLDFTQNLEEATDAITLGRPHSWLASEGFSLSTANADVQELPATLCH